VLLGTYAFAFQIYGDFSGYSSIAQGLARLLGFKLMWNFRMPYFAVSPSDFWQRWHISLSSWLRDYLYIPLGGNRKGSWQTARNLSLTMLLGGLWHGANWTFLVWGALHGLVLIVYRAFPQLGDSQTATPSRARFLRIFRALIFFHIVCLTWVFFRAESVTQAMAMLGSLLNTSGWQAPFVSYAMGMLIFFLVPFAAYELWLERKADQLALLQQPVTVQGALYVYFFLMIIAFVPGTPQVFIYFQF
jgi:D-alanyl-lipoteichoic acid acyltransferase DltB (MBOAT superfamily)